MKSIITIMWQMQCKKYVTLFDSISNERYSTAIFLYVKDKILWFDIWKLKDLIEKPTNFPNKDDVDTILYVRQSNYLWKIETYIMRWNSPNETIRIFAVTTCLKLLVIVADINHLCNCFCSAWLCGMYASIGKLFVISFPWWKFFENIFKVKVVELKFKNLGHPDKKCLEFELHGYSSQCYQQDSVSENIFFYGGSSMKLYSCSFSLLPCCNENL